MSNRYDSLDRYYKPMELFGTISTMLYWLLAVLSLITLYVKNTNINNLLSNIFILLTLVFFISNNYLKIYLIPNIENKRRVHMLSNSLDIYLDHESTNGYYNNQIKPSILKLGANLFENSLFAKTVVSKMLILERSKIFIYFLSFIALILYRGINVSAVGIVANTLFCGEVLSKWLYMEYLKCENEKIFEDMNRLFLNYTDNKICEFEAQIIDNFVRYESAKAYCGIKQSSKIFFKINSETSNHWEEIKKNLKIDQY